jgi:putative lipoprotein
LNAATRLNTAVILITCAMVLGGCGSSAPRTEVATQQAPAVSTPPASSKPPLIARFDCDTLALTATFHEDRVVVEVPEQRPLTLPHVVSASGARYSDGTNVFWNKGREATFERHGRGEMCRERREPWQEAADRGVDFRAVGQEPGWFLEIDNEKQIRVVYDYAEHQLIAPVTSPATKGSTVFYDMMVDSQRVLITIEETPCNDAMSGEAFPRSVAVTIGTRTLRGCGKEIAGGR